MVRLETRPPNLEGEGQITMRDLVRNCLRMRPERIIVGEVRGPEAFDLLQAMNTGHDGSMGTLHANMPREALSRLESMITMGGYSLPSRTIREMICGSIDVVIQAARLRDGSRRITHITEVMGMEGDVIITQDLFLYDIHGRGRERQSDRRASIDRDRPSEILGSGALLRRGGASRRRARCSAGRRRRQKLKCEIRTMQTYGLFFLVAVAIGGVAWVFVYPLLSGERQRGAAHGERRALRAGAARPIRGAQKIAARAGRRHAQGARSAAKEGQARAAVRSHRAGRARLVEAPFHGNRGVLGVVAFLVAMSWAPACWPRWASVLRPACGLAVLDVVVSQEAARGEIPRRFPDAVDVIVRGIKAGLPLLDSLKLIATEAEEPIRSEFRGIIDTQTIGIPLGEACLKLYERMPLPEANFFGIVISIQQRAGGNLSEALGNLSRVLRDRKKMKAKIQAMSMEAKASAAIIGALPIVVMTLVYITSPQYIDAALDRAARAHDDGVLRASGCRSASS